MTKMFCCKTKKLLRLALVFLFGAALVTGCKDDFDGYFDIPDSMEGPIYEQLSARPELSEFVKAIDRIPLMKNIINTSGLYTVFAPTNDAVKKYFETQTRYPGKTKIEDFDVEKVVLAADGVTKTKPDSIALSQFVEAHLAIDMYFHYDFKRFIPDEIIGSTGVSFGAVTDRNRYSTRYREQNFVDTLYNEQYQDGLTSRNRIRKVRPQYKSLNIYPYKYLRRHNIVNEFTELYDVKGSIGSEDLFVNGVRVIEKDIAAVNGVIHVVEGVLEMQPNLDMYLKEHNPTFWALAQTVANYRFNESATEQEGVSKFDSLWTKEYNGMLDFASEYDASFFTFLAPGKAFEKFVQDSIFPTYRIDVKNEVADGNYTKDKLYKLTQLDSIPMVVRNALLAQFFAVGTVWSSKLDFGFVTVFGDTLQTKDQTNRPANLEVKGRGSMTSNALLYELPDDVANISPIFQSTLRLPITCKGTDPNKPVPYKWYLDFLWRGTMWSELGKHYEKYTVFMPTCDALYQEPCSVRELESSRFKGMTELNRYGLELTTLSMDSIVQYLVIPDVVLTPDSLEGVQFRKSYLGSFLQIDGSDPNDLKIKFEYTIPGTQERKAYEARIPNKPATDPERPLEGYHLTQNGIVYPINDYVPMVDGMTVNAYLNLVYSKKSEYSNIIELFKNTKVHGELEEGEKDYVNPDNDLTLWQMLLSTDFKSEDIYTVLMPTNAALQKYKTDNRMSGDISASDLTSGKHWQRVARQCILRTRVYTDGSHIQNYYDVYANPVEGEENVYQTMCYKKVYSEENYFNQNEYATLKLIFDKENTKITFIEPTADKEITTTGKVNTECVNGVIHEIDVLPFPDLSTKAERDNFVERPDAVEVETN